MPRIEIVPNSTSVSAPGWAYVPDNGYDPSKVAIQPSGARKRAARASGLGIGDNTTRQQNAVLKHLADLDKDSHRDVQIVLPSKQKDALSRGELCNTSSDSCTFHIANKCVSVKAEVYPKCTTDFDISKNVCQPSGG